jgi:DNA-directed RNA polymerase subunit M/transcription elongation factor TFIIS
LTSEFLSNIEGENIVPDPSDTIPDNNDDILLECPACHSMEIFVHNSRDQYNHIINTEYICRNCSYLWKQEKEEELLK